MKLILPPDYVRQAARDIRKARKRVLLISMVIADHPSTHELIAALEDAARRGVSVKVAADVFTYGEVSGSFLPIRYYSPDARQTTKMGKDLRTAGVKFTWLGHGRMTMFNGRTHSKWCIVDDRSYVFGGVNVYEGGLASADYMFRVDNPRLADRLEYEQNRILKAERAAVNYPSVVYELDGDKVMFDGGIMTQSIIYRRACELAAEAKEVLYVSQYCPSAKLARIIRKKKARLYFNHPHQANFFNGALIKLNMTTSRLQTRYTRDRYLHAKFIVFTMPDGSKAAITGSHNFAYTGVLLGTREVALETKDPSVIAQLESFAKQEVF